MDNARIAARRTLRYIKAPQGLATGVLFALVGIPFSAAFEEQVTVAALDALVLFLPLILWYLVTFLVQLRLVESRATTKVVKLKGDNFTVDKNGWRLAVGTTDSGVTLAIGLVDSQQGWPVVGVWQVTDPYLDVHRVLIRSVIPPVAGVAYPVWAQVTWPLDFPQAEVVGGRHTVSWVERGESLVTATFDVDVSRS